MITLMYGDARSKLQTLPENSVHTCVTSPPYFGLRNYNIAGQIGIEKTPDEFVASLVEVFREVRRVLRGDGTLWLNIGDTYANGRVGRYDSGPVGVRPDKRGRGRFGGADMGTMIRSAPPGFKDKDLLMIPARLAIALQEDGWYLRSEIIWHKPNVMPESVTDRPTNCHEKIFLLSKSEYYFYDQDAVREDAYTKIDNEIGRNRRNVWTVRKNTSSGDGHFATYPTSLIMPCIQAGTSRGGACAACGAPLIYEYKTEIGEEDHELFTSPTKNFHVEWKKQCSHDDAPIARCIVLDPFFGTGTTAVAAHEYGQDAIGIEMNPDYGEIAVERLTTMGLQVAIV